MSTLTVLAVDDELPQLRDLARLLRASPQVGEVQTASSPQEAVLKASQHSYDAAFLDVRMPELDGLELARVLNAFTTAPALVFVSAFDTSAVATFELRAVDYLMKPVTAPRVEEALKRVRATLASSEPVQRSAASGRGPDSDVLAVDNLREGGTRLLARSSILYFQAHGDYVRVFADSGRYLLRASLTDVERRFSAHGFLRVHRQYLVNLRRATEVRAVLNGTAVLRFEQAGEVPVARRHVPELRRRLRT
ncbi:MAG: response regulator transcription factor [Solirubrobacterales bacterium]|nr:response regulator transcription factor [Solirubrobacterales bacterium]MBV9471551.1 response regulator transcription factor [Solirubrobacterales bacterium]